MLAIESNDKIKIVVGLKLYQAKNMYLIQFNDDEVYKTYTNKEEAMVDFIKLSSFLKRKELRIERI